MANKLQHESSPYLLQHAHNPVDWYAWGPEAFDRAMAEDKPVLVSIGYSTCHWCHVMERESFEDEQTAALMNERFINIKLDREEHPEIDQIYMEAVQLLTGGGGWPLNCFLLPDKRPFFGGTYYPPQASYNRPSWQDVLHHISKIYKEKREVVEGQADKLTELIKNGDKKLIDSSFATLKNSTPQKSDWSSLGKKLSDRYDTEWGGVGGAPKFPSMPSMFLTTYLYYYTGEERHGQHAAMTMQKMMMGGIHDVAGGGFARYATDKAWRIPHFEKMLYDNAQILEFLSILYKLESNPVYLKCAEDIVSFLEREMKSDQGLFFAALDADSEGVEGKFYTWSKAEILDHADSGWVDHIISYHMISDSGNWEGTNILYSDSDPLSYATEHDLNPDQWEGALDDFYGRLMETRASRIRPSLDHKILLSWNALLATALFQWKEAAPAAKLHQHAEFFLNQLIDRFYEPGNGVRRLMTDGIFKLNGNLDDYAYLIQALITGQQASDGERYIEVAIDLCNYVLDHFSDEEDLLFYFTPEGDENVVVRKKDVYDDALPCSNAVMCKNLIILGTILGREDLKERSVNMYHSITGSISRFPSAMATWCQAGLLIEYSIFEVEITGVSKGDWKKNIRQFFLPNKVISSRVNELLDETILTQSDLDQVFICKDNACEMPLNDFDKAVQRIKNIT